MDADRDLLYLFTFGVGLLILLLWEMGQWRQTGSVLSGRQRNLRLLTVGLLAIILAMMAAGTAGVVHGALTQLLLLTAILFLTVVVMALAIRDMRELRTTRRAREMRMAGDVARLIASELCRREPPVPVEDEPN